MRRALRLLAPLLAAALLLGGCVITSVTDLVTDDEATTPLPASFSMYTYKQGPGGFIRAEDAPMAYTLDGKRYRAATEASIIQLAPLADHTYLLAASGDDPGTLYGVLSYDHDIVAIRMILGEKLAATVAAFQPPAPADIASDIVLEDGGIIVTKRATLDFLVQRLRDGQLPTTPLVAWIGPPDAKPPMMIVEDGDGFRASP